MSPLEGPRQEECRKCEASFGYIVSHIDPASVHRRKNQRDLRWWSVTRVGPERKTVGGRNSFPGT